MERRHQILWEPSNDFIRSSNLKRFEGWLRSNKGLEFKNYQALWQWSIHDVEAFWEAIWQYFEIIHHSDYQAVLRGTAMPYYSWFEGATLNYAEHIFRNRSDAAPALVFRKEDGATAPMSWQELETRVSRVQSYLLEMDVQEGDRVAAYLPNIPETIILFLAVNSIGAIWSCCSPDFGVSTVIERFSQIEPKILFSVDGYRYAGKSFPKHDEIIQIQQALPTVKVTVWIAYLDAEYEIRKEGNFHWQDIMARPSEPLHFRPVPFSHPIWILYSSGTTGRPKAITHSHGGVLLEHLKYLTFHNDVRPGENFFWFTTTGWMMWNFLQASMLAGATAVLFDGSPAHPDLYALWDFATELPIHHFGTSAPYLIALMQQSVAPAKKYDLSSLRSVGSTGSPLPPEVFEYVYRNIADDVWLCSISGGTDVCTAFVGGNPYAPVCKGLIQSIALGCALKGYDENGQAVTNELGEMVIEQPMPCMPIYFWNDPDDKRYHASYFETYPGKWRHGDWIKVFPNGSLIIQGRSDATLNRKGVRIGTAEIYNVLDKLTELSDSLILNLERSDGSDFMPLFVVLSQDSLSKALREKITKTLRSECSPRHVPDQIIQVPDIPYTLSGKKMEVPVKKILLGIDDTSTVNKDAVRNPNAIQFFEKLAYQLRETYLS